MKVKISEKNINEVLKIPDLEKLFKHFSMLTGIDVSLHDVSGKEIISHRLCPEGCICELVKKNGNNPNCDENMAYAGMKAADLGEPYIFKCGYLIKCSAPILFEEKIIGSVSCGPVLLWDIDEIAISELKSATEKLKINSEYFDTILKNVKQLTCENMTSAAQMLSIIVDFMCKEESKFLEQRSKINRQQAQIAELLYEKKQNVASLIALEKRAKFRKYPLEMEKELIAYVQTGDKNNARRMLNDLMGEIFSFSSGNLDIVKAKLYELSAIILRAAVDSGAPLLNLAKIIKDYSKILSDETGFEEICMLTSEVMETIMNIIYENRAQKQTNQNIVKAINYIQQNYNQDLSLESVAKNVFVSNYYLSHLFREEMNMTFIDYLNKVRMEHSLSLMKSGCKNIQYISEKVGYNDANYFTKSFKKHYGVTPKNYMKIYDFQE